MSPTTAVKSNVIDFIQPEKAKDVGGELEVSTKALVQRFGTVAVVDQASCQQAVNNRQAIGLAVKNIETFFQPFTSMADKLHKALTSRRGEILAPLLLLDSKLRIAIGDYAAAETRAREAREREIAERQRQVAQDRAAQEAAQLESAGEHAMAAAVMEEAIAAPVPVVVLTDTNKQVEGLNLPRTWKWRLPPGKTEADVVVGTGPALVDVVQHFVDKFPGEAAMEPLARALMVERRLVSRAFLCLDQKKIGANVRAMKGAQPIQGLEIYYEDLPRR